MKWLAFCLLFCATAAHAHWWSSTGARAGANVRPTYKQADIQRARVEIQRAFAAGDIDKLERMHEEFLALQKARGAGRYMIQSFTRMVAHATRDRAKMAATFERWRQERPDSALRVVFEAEALERSAWAHRGGGYASTVSPEAMKLFGDDLERAAALLQKAGPKIRTTPLYYQNALSIAGASGRPPEVLDALFAEGVARFPIDWEIHQTRLNFLLPQWGGSTAQMERFIRQAALRTQASEGTSMYALLWGSVVGRLGESRDFFGDTGARWADLRHAFEDALALENSTSTRNLYATFACIAKDRDTLRRQARILGEFADYGGARSFVSPDACEEMGRPN